MIEFNNTKIIKEDNLYVVQRKRLLGWRNMDYKELSGNCEGTIRTNSYLYAYRIAKTEDYRITKEKRFSIEASILILVTIGYYLFKATNYDTNIQAIYVIICLVFIFPLITSLFHIKEYIYKNFKKILRLYQYNKKKETI